MRIHTTHPIIWCGIACTLAGLFLPRVADAAPSLTVSNQGPNLSGNLEWLVEVSPDATLFTNTGLGLGGSLAVELALEISGSELLGITVNAADWPLDISGNNPFTRTVTMGALVNMANDTVFASLLSNFFAADTAVEVLTIETSGSGCTTVMWGGQTVLEGEVDEYEGALIAQAGQNFTGYQGSSAEPAGDFDADCDVDGADLLEWQQNFGSPYVAADLTDWEANYGTVVPLQALTISVPEPSAIVLLLFCLSALSVVRQTIPS
ncbi:MAG: hypothetical protein GXP24_14525 [Planctomycetes bacterium]|nr:hypothetical protein [Planctomycetota bacterium]